LKAPKNEWIFFMFWEVPPTDAYSLAVPPSTRLFQTKLLKNYQALASVHPPLCSMKLNMLSLTLAGCAYTAKKDEIPIKSGSW
jgi:hypothetical protein